MKEKVLLTVIHNSPSISVEEIAGMALFVFVGAVVVYLLMEAE